MARASGRPNNDTATAPDTDSVSGYFRKLFKETPRLLRSRSNDEILKKWLEDHPGHTEVPKNVKNSLSNLKSVLRKRRRKRKQAAAEGAAAPAAGREAARPRSVSRGLETLEEQIDDCLSHAKELDRDGLHEVIRLLRKARNEVVWKTGQ